MHHSNALPTTNLCTMYVVSYADDQKPQATHGKVGICAEQQRLLESTRPGRPDHSLLLDANKRLDTIIQMSRNRSAIATSAHLIPDVLSAKTSRFPLDRAGSELSKDTGASNVPHAKPQVQNLEQFMSRVNCSQVVDAFSKRPMVTRTQ